MLTPFQPTQERYAVKDFAVHVIIHINGSVAVAQELHIGEHAEAAPLKEIRSIGRRHQQQGERNLVPLRTRLQRNVHFAPRRKPKPFVDGSFREEIGIIASHHPFQSHGMSQSNDRGITVYRTTGLLGINIGLMRCIAQGDGCFGCSQAVNQRRRRIPVVEYVVQFTGRFINGTAQLQLGRETAERFLLIAKSKPAEIHHLVHGSRLK